MTPSFVTRYSGAVRWAEAEGIPVDRLVEHFEWPRDLLQVPV